MLIGCNNGRLAFPLYYCDLSTLFAGHKWFLVPVSFDTFRALTLFPWIPCSFSRGLWKSKMLYNYSSPDFVRFDKNQFLVSMIKNIFTSLI